MKKGKSSLILAVFFFILIAPLYSAAEFDHVVVNSEKWTDVYSGIHYSNLQDTPVDFLVSEKHAGQVIDALDNNKSMMVLSSSDSPYTYNYPRKFRDNDYKDAQEISSRNLNLELIQELENITNFIVVSDLYGYSSLAVAPYAIQTNSWVFFADESNIDEIDEILTNREVDDLLIYGYVDREVRDTLEEYSPETIYNSNRFEDNIEIVEKFLEIKETKQVTLSNGDFIELEIMGGKHPILFTGKQNVPEEIQEYLKSSPIEIGVLVGNELVGAATNIRSSTDINVMVKLARGARVQEGGVSQVEGLDLFPVPSPLLELEVYSVDYNILTGNLEVTYKSSSNIPLYLEGTITIGEGDDRIKLHNNESIFVGPESYKTIEYEDDDLEGFDPENGTSANLFVTYGETAGSLDRVIDESHEIKRIEFSDNCEMDIEEVIYNKQDKRFEIEVKNTGEEDCYVRGFLRDVVMGIDENNLGSEEIEEVSSGKKGSVYINEELTEEDLEENEFIDTVIEFGERETSLVQSDEEEMELKIKTFGTTTYVTAALFLIATSSFGIFFYKRRKEKKIFDI